MEKRSIDKAHKVYSGPSCYDYIKAEKILREVYSKYSGVMLEEIKSRINKEISTDIVVDLPKKVYCAYSGPKAANPEDTIVFPEGTIEAVFVAELAILNYKMEKHK
jgi:hypothetical protein